MEGGRHVTNFVGASRDGDQFHYYWAARRCLKLLDPVSDLSSIVVEGVADSTPGESP